MGHMFIKQLLCRGRNEPISLQLSSLPSLGPIKHSLRRESCTLFFLLGVLEQARLVLTEGSPGSTPQLCLGRGEETRLDTVGPSL